MIRILAISGSLRSASSNTSLVRAATKLAPDSVEIIIYGGLADLPHFSPDLDEEARALHSVGGFRRQLQMSDGVLISSPEYAHGVPGALKNALDWLVGSGEMVNKPVALINASTRATHAQASLTEILTTMAASVVADASITVPLDGRKLDEAGIIHDPEASGLLRSSIVALVGAIEGKRSESGNG
ncbi:MAG: NAD(P)H-dependent oxidoreductase [Pyrinomonadaceae bacterium]